MHVLIVGASVAGVAAADGLRAQGFGGSITLLDQERGLPYDKPPLSKHALAPAWDPAKGLLRPERHYAERRIRLALGRRAVGLDADSLTVTLDDDTTLRADSIVLAPGVRARRLAESSMLPGVHPIRSVSDSLAVRDALSAEPRVVVVGGGFIGAEAASVAARMGAPVTVVDLLDTPFGSLFGTVVGEAMTRWHTEAGVRLETGVAVREVQGDGRAERVVLTDGRALGADLVILGLGAEPAVDWLESSAVELDDGIVCDEFGRTSVPGVWACGDAAAWPTVPGGEPTRIEHWTTAKEQGSAVAHNIAQPDAAPRPVSTVPYFWSDQYGRRLQFLGTTTGHDTVQIAHGALDEREFVVLYGRDGTLIGALGVAATRQLMRYRPAIERRSAIDDVVSPAPTCIGA